MTPSPKEIIQRVPQWKDADDIHVSLLAGGITNKNYLVQIEHETVVLRVSGAKTELLGIDREHEYAAHRVAAAAGIAPKIIHFIRPEGFLITRFIHGQLLSTEDLRQPHNIQRVAKVLKIIHTLPTIAANFSPFRTVENYTDIARHYKVVFPDAFDWVLEHMRIIEVAFHHNPFGPCLCHNDLLTENFLEDGQIRILDWEYAGMGDPFFDLANFAAHHAFSDVEDRLLLKDYYGAATSTRLAKLNLMKIMSDFREAMWGMVQTGISSLDFDFRAYADTYFANLKERLQDPRVGQWLVEVKQGV